MKFIIIFKENVYLRLGSKVESWQECTHLITDKPRRTAKYVCVVGSGKPVISISYLSHPNDPIEKHEIVQRPSGFLKDFCVWSSVKSVPPRQDMKEMVESAGGEVSLHYFWIMFKFITTSPNSYKGDKELLVLGCEQDITACAKFKKKVFTCKYIISSILEGKFLDDEEFVLIE